MKKFFKWLGIGLGVIISLIVIIIFIVLWKHNRFGFYSSGGPISENQTAYDITFYNINLEVDMDEKFLSGYTKVQIKTLGKEITKIELDLLDHFDVKKITLQDQEILFEHDDHKLWLLPETHLIKNTSYIFKIEYSGNPVEAIIPPWIDGFNWSEDSSGSHWVGLSSQGTGGKLWFPCKDSQYDKPDSVSINITVPKDYFCASNGLLKRTTVPRDGMITYHWFTKYPISNYNINISIGKYEIIKNEYITEEGKVMPLYFYVLPQSKDLATSHLEMAKNMLYTYRKFYGEYPFTKEKFAIVQTDYIGMEHQTINAYGNSYEYRSINGKEFDKLMLHEMGHEWWGNKVSCKSWSDLWIHEGICTYGEALYQLDKNGEDAYHNYMKGIKRRIFNQSPIIPKKDANTREVYSVDIYTKGAALIHSLRYVLGDSIFFPTLKQFATDSIYTYKNTVTTDDFINLINQNSNLNLSEYIKDFLFTTNLLKVQIDSLGNDSYNISLPNINYQLPMDIKTTTGNEKKMLSQNPILVFSQNKPVIDKKGWYLKKRVKMK